MSQRRPNRPYAPPASSPGRLRPAETRFEGVTLRLMHYGVDGVDEQTTDDVAEALEAPTERPYTWIDVQGLHDVEVVRSIGLAFGFHVLALEDVVHDGQRPRATPYDGYWFAVTSILGFAPSAPEQPPRVDQRQLAIFFDARRVVTMHQLDDDVLEPIRIRLRAEGGRMRARGPDYLAYALLDAAVDSFFPTLEGLGESFEDLETQLLADPRPHMMRNIRSLKRELLELRRVAWPNRELIASLSRDETGLVADETKVFLRDSYEHSIEALDVVETYRELAAGLVDLYLTSTAARTNEVMRILTVIATIFLPLTFIAGIYGMNFNPTKSPLNMPELNWSLGYPFALAVMLLVAGGMVLWFRRRDWL